MLNKKKILTNPVHLLAFGFGSGLAPKAPGTFGTLAAIPFYLVIQYLPLWQYGLFLLVAFAVGVQLCGRTSDDLGVHDHPGIVWDEFVGYWITMFAAPQGWVWVVLGFILFRFFDVLKPWPIRWIDHKVEGGFGIMFDDVLAGIFALIGVQLVVYFGLF